MDCWRLLIPVLRLLRCKGLLLCPVGHTMVPPERLAKCWDRCPVRGCIPVDLRRQPQRLKTNKLKLVMTRVEEVHVADDLTVCEPPQVTGSDVAAEVLYPFFEDHLHMYEAMRLMLLDTSKRAKGVVTIGQGGIARVVADHRLVFAAALKTMTPSIILAHNHPSGLINPSKEDISWTKRAVEIGALHDIAVEDHIILGQRDYFSFRDHRLI